MSHSDQFWKPLARKSAAGSGYDAQKHGPRRVVGPGFREQVYAVVCTVPAGSVTTYGDVAGQLGLRSVARQVGFALAALPPEREDVPWHRVVNARGAVSARGAGDGDSEQAVRLRTEGVPVGPAGRVTKFADRRHQFDVQ